MAIRTSRAETLRNDTIAAAISASPLTAGAYERMVDELNAATSWVDLSALVRSFGLREIGRGVGRRVFLLHVEGYEPTALKVATDAVEGALQSTAEWYCALLSTSPLVPELYAWGCARWGLREPAISWVELELLWDLDADGFYETTGYPFPPVHPGYPDALPEFAAALAALESDCPGVLHELCMHHQWGITSDGLLRVADLGVVGWSALVEARSALLDYEPSHPPATSEGSAAPRGTL